MRDKSLIASSLEKENSDSERWSCSKFLSHQIAKIPFVTTWNACDIFPSNHPLNLGIIGMSGQRGANKAIFNSDLLVCLGTHLSIPHTTTLYKSYAEIDEW